MRGRVHELKTWVEYFGAVESGRKRFEIRYNDRGFEVGHVLRLREWHRHEERYTGRDLVADVTFVTDFGCAPGFVCMSIALRTAPSTW